MNQLSRKVLKHLLLYSVLIVFLGSCGGGSDTPPANQGPDVPEKTYLYYLTDRSSGSELVIVDPDNPPSVSDSKTKLLSQVGYVSTLTTITPDVTGYDIYTNPQPDISSYSFEEYVIAQNTSGFWKSNSDISQSTTPVRISAATGGAACDVFNGVTAEQEYYITETSADNCSNVKRELIISDMDSTTPPVDITALQDLPLAYLFDRQYKLTGWLVKNGTSLLRYNRDFSSSVTVTGVAPVESVLFAWPTPSGNILLFGLDNIYIYNPTANTISASVYTSSSGSYTLIPFEYDQNEFYFVDNDTIYRVDSEFATTPVSVTDGVDKPSSLFFGYQGQVCYITVLGNGDEQLINLNLSTGVKTPLVTVTGGEQLDFYYQQGQRVFYNVTGAVSQRAESILIDATGDTSVNNASWIGAAFDNEYSYEPTAALILLNGLLPGATNLNGTALETYDGATGSKVRNIGAMPDGLELPFLVTGNARALLFRTPLASSSGTDIFYMSATKDNSLQRITDDSSFDIDIDRGDSVLRIGDIPVASSLLPGFSGQSTITTKNLLPMQKFKLLQKKK